MTISEERDMWQRRAGEYENSWEMTANALATAEQQLAEALELLKEVDTAVSGGLLDRIIAFITAHIAAHGGAK